MTCLATDLWTWGHTSFREFESVSRKRKCKSREKNVAKNWQRRPSLFFRRSKKTAKDVLWEANGEEKLQFLRIFYIFTTHFAQVFLLHSMRARIPSQSTALYESKQSTCPTRWMEANKNSQIFGVQSQGRSGDLENNLLLTGNSLSESSSLCFLFAIKIGKMRAELFSPNPLS